jgi:hypothetical protein
MMLVERTHIFPSFMQNPDEPPTIRPNHPSYKGYRIFPGLSSLTAPKMFIKRVKGLKLTYTG